MPKCILVFAGHMIDAPYRATSCFPAWAEAAVRLKIRRAIQRLSPAVAVSSAACGGDIIFAEEIRSKEHPSHKFSFTTSALRAIQARFCPG